MIELKENLDINIKVKTIDGNEFCVNISKTHKIGELKGKIEEVSPFLLTYQLTQVPVNKQRLIFQGKLLKDNDLIESYKITDYDVIHLVARVNIQPEDPDIQNSLSAEFNRDNVFNDIGTFSFLNRIRPLERTSSLNNMFRDYNSMNPLRRRNQPTNRNENLGKIVLNENMLDFNLNDCLESISQNYLTINNLRDSTANFLMNNQQTLANAVNNLSNSHAVDLFDFKKRKLIKGQWVDVKDTIDQWLEAQVIDVNINSAFIHYNGWGERWDEWIPFDSLRIMPFRYHTSQTNITNFQSPFPKAKPVSNLTEKQCLFNLFDELGNY